MRFLALLALLLGFSAAQALNDWPIVGIFAQPSTSTQGNCNGNCQYIAASYVKYIEASGARVVPINYYASTSELDELFSSLNGFFFTGGGSTFPKSAQYIFDKVVSSNKNGDHMPLWGTCMGFQWLLLAATRNSINLDPPQGQLDAENYSIPLDFTEGAFDARILRDAPKKILDVLATENVTMNNHHYGIFPKHFASTPQLTSFYKVLSTNVDRQGVEFVSMIEAFDYPIFGAQWHPEKNNFEWNKVNGIPYEAINHSPEAVEVSQYFANFFVEETRKNDHAFASASEEDAKLIYNYPVSKTTGDFSQTYFFHF